MSYILDALKKSEEERRRGSVPDHLTVQEPLRQERKRRPLWPYLVIAALVVNAAVFAIWFDTRSKKSESVIRAVAEMREKNSAEEARSSFSAEGEGGSVARPNEGRETASSKAVVTESAGYVQQNHGQENAKKRVGEHREDRLGEVKKRVANDLSAKETAATSARTDVKPENIPLPSPNRVYRLSELPGAIRQTLPELLISVFLYSDDPSSRLVRVNGQMLKEGQYLSDGLRLEQIVPGGVIFSYQKFRFLIGPK